LLLRVVLEVPNEGVQLRLKRKEGASRSRVFVARLTFQALCMVQLCTVEDLLLKDEIVAVTVLNRHKTDQVFGLLIQVVAAKSGTVPPTFLRRTTSPNQSCAISDFLLILLRERGEVTQSRRSMSLQRVTVQSLERHSVQPLLRLP